MLGIKFKGKHSFKDFGLSMKSEERTLLPDTKRQEINLPFLNGVIDLQEDPIYENRTMTLHFFKRVNSLEESHVFKRQLATWLTGKGELVFDDEATLTYNAKVVDSINYSPKRNFIKISVNFECDPFAYEKVRKHITKLIINNNDTIIVDNNGNVSTKPFISLTNVGTTTVNNLDLRLERLKE